MALQYNEMEALFSVARAFCVKLQAGTAIADSGTDIPVVADFPGMHSVANTTAKIAALLNRHEAEKESSESRRKRIVGALPES